MIQFPKTPDRVLQIAEFEVVFDRSYKVKLTKNINGTTSYLCECLNEDVEPSVKLFIENTIISQANKIGAFEPVK